MKVVFRADASVKMGSGHVMRCLTLAKELKENGAEVIFISRAHDGNLNQLIIRKGFQVIEFPKPIGADIGEASTNGDDYNDWLGVAEEQDAKETIEAIGGEQSDWLIVDHYSLSEKWEKLVRSYVGNIMVIDDLANRPHDCDLLLDQNWFEDMGGRYGELVPLGCTKLFGPEFALLRPEFAEARKRIKPRLEVVECVFVFFGGSDPHNLTGMTLRALSKPGLAHLEVHAVIGENNPHRDEIHELVQLRNNTSLHIQVDDIASIMAKADFAIGSGGVNTWERICLGLPSITVGFADNQILLLQRLQQNGFVKNLGRVDEIDEELIQKETAYTINDPLLLSDQSKKMFDLVNGNGSQMVTGWLMGDLSCKTWEVRNANNKDMELFWVWANDGQVRINAINKEPITIETHSRWFQTKLSNCKCTLYLILVENRPVGQVRFDIEENFARIDYSIAKQFRGRKIGKTLLKEAISKYWSRNKIKLLGEVMPHNIASEKIFKSLGFRMKTEGDNKIFMKEANQPRKKNEKQKNINHCSSS